MKYFASEKRICFQSQKSGIFKKKWPPPASPKSIRALAILFRVGCLLKNHFKKSKQVIADIKNGST